MQLQPTAHQWCASSTTTEARKHGRTPNPSGFTVLKSHSMENLQVVLVLLQHVFLCLKKKKKKAYSKLQLEKPQLCIRSFLVFQYFDILNYQIKTNTSSSTQMSITTETCSYEVTKEQDQKKPTPIYIISPPQTHM